METIQPLTENRPSTEAGKRYIPRSLAGLIAIFAAIFVMQVLRTNSQEAMSLWICGFISIPATMVILCTWFVFKGHNTVSRARMECALIGGLSIGGIAFLGGFVGPMLFMSESNQGPLLGIFVTGPIGFLVGNVLGLIYGFLGKHKQKEPSSLGTA